MTAQTIASIICFCISGIAVPIFLIVVHLRRGREFQSSMNTARNLIDQAQQIRLDAEQQSNQIIQELKATKEEIEHLRMLKKAGKVPGKPVGWAD